MIIARTDLPSSQLKVSNPESHNFAATLVIPSAIPGLSFRVPRGWSAVDVKLRGKTVRFANTHLEAFSTTVRNQQARELAAALAEVADPVVLVGDLNSQPDDTAGAYGTFAAAGYVVSPGSCSMTTRVDQDTGRSELLNVGNDTFVEAFGVGLPPEPRREARPTASSITAGPTWPHGRGWPGHQQAHGGLGAAPSWAHLA